MDDLDLYQSIWEYLADPTHVSDRSYEIITHEFDYWEEPEGTDPMSYWPTEVICSGPGIISCKHKPDPLNCQSW